MSGDSVLGPMVQVIFVCLMDAVADARLTGAAQKEKIAKRSGKNYRYQQGQGGPY
jgi:hypothetical protein